MSPFSETWYWIGVALMALGSVVFGVGAARATTRRWQILFGLDFFICLIATVLYLTMATGYGAVQVGPQRTVWVRYVTWILSTPLLILDLAYLGRSRLPLTGSLLGANTFMIATGFVATIVQSPYNVLWYGISSAAFLAIFAALLGPYQRQAREALPKTYAAGAFKKIALVHLALWTLYPALWIVSPEGYELVGGDIEAMGFTILDVASKVGFGFLSLNTLRQIEKQGEAGRLEVVPA